MYDLIGNPKDMFSHDLSHNYYSVITLIAVYIVPSWDIKGRELVSICRYPHKRQYSQYQ